MSRFEAALAEPQAVPTTSKVLKHLYDWNHQQNLPRITISVMFGRVDGQQLGGGIHRPISASCSQTPSGTASQRFNLTDQAGANNHQSI